MVEMNVGYAKSIPGILKILEIFLLLISFSCMADCCSGASGRYSFFLAVGIIGWLVALGLFIIYLFKLNEQMSQINFDVVLLISSCVFAVLLLISGSLMADSANKSKALYSNYHVNSSLVRHYGNAWWDVMVAGIVFGFIAMVVFIVDAVVHLRAVKGGSAGGGGGAAAKA